MQIQTVSIIGAGAVGALFGMQMNAHLPKGALKIVADAARVRRYRDEGIYCNGERCPFTYISDTQETGPADLVLFAVKANDLDAALHTARLQVGPDTIILSLLNGIRSEEIVGRAFGMEKVLYSVAQGMDAVKVRNQLTYHTMGMIAFGDYTPGPPSEKALAVEEFFTKTHLPHALVPDIRHHQWGKFMLNVGLNQVAAVHGCDYEGVQKEGPLRDRMIFAMREVMTLSEKENVPLTEKDLAYWLDILAALNPKGKPSMQQDVEARRFSEVELFAGTVLALGQKHGINFPVNRWLYEKMKEIESQY